MCSALRKNRIKNAFTALVLLMLYCHLKWGKESNKMLRIASINEKYSVRRLLPENLILILTNKIKCSPLGQNISSINPTQTATPSISLLPSSIHPTRSPPIFSSLLPSGNPSEYLSRTPSIYPSAYPSEESSIDPSTTPSQTPSQNPTLLSSVHPSVFPSLFSSVVPSAKPSIDWNPKIKISAPDSASGDYFGRSVSISSSSVVVGAYRNDDNGTDSGSAYLFDLSGNFVAKLLPPDGSPSDNFGVSVSTSNSTVVVGSSFDDDNGSNSGSAYVFDTSGGFVTKLVAPDPESRDYFGWSVAVSDNNIVIGAYRDGDNGFLSGSAYIFDVLGTFVAKLLASESSAGDYFGYSVDISGGNIVVGAHLDDDNGSDSGSTYLFSSTGSFLKKILAPDGMAEDNFGISVAISESYILIGAYFDDDNGTRSGAAYLFDIVGNFVAKLIAPDGAALDRFGASVAVSESVLVIGAYDDDNENGDNSGSVYIFDTEGNFLNKLLAVDGANEDVFGYSVAVSETKIIVGMYGDDDNGSLSGSAYIIK